MTDAEARAAAQRLVERTAPSATVTSSEVLAKVAAVVRASTSPRKSKADAA